MHPGGCSIVNAEMQQKQNSEDTATRIGIIGAGISGLSCAARLVRDLPETGAWHVHIIEKESRIGGRIETSVWQGHKIEIGPQWIHGWHGNPIARLADSLGLEVERLEPETVSTVDWQSGRRFDGHVSQLEIDFLTDIGALYGRMVTERAMDTNAAAVLRDLRAGSEGQAFEARFLKDSVREGIPTWLPLRRSLAGLAARGLRSLPSFRGCHGRLSDWMFEENLGVDMGVSPKLYSAKRVFWTAPIVMHLRRGDAVLPGGYDALPSGLLHWIKTRTRQRPNVTVSLHLGAAVDEWHLGERIEVPMRGERLSLSRLVVTWPGWVWAGKEHLADEAFRRSQAGIGVAHLARCHVKFRGDCPFPVTYTNIVGVEGSPIQWYRQAPDLMVGVAYGAAAQDLERVWRDDPDRIRAKLRSVFEVLRYPEILAVDMTSHSLRGGSYSFPKVGAEERALYPRDEDRRVLCAGEHCVPFAEPDTLMRLAAEDSSRSFPKVPLEQLLEVHPGFLAPSSTHSAFNSGIIAASKILESFP